MRRQVTSAGGTAGLLMVAAGLLTIVYNALPGAGKLGLGLYVTGGLAVAVGLTSLLVPWQRLPPRATLCLVITAFALIAVSDTYGGLSAYSYGVYFVVVFVWIGMAHPPGTSLAMTPPAVLAYLLPDLMHRGSTEQAKSMTVAIPVCILAAELISRGIRQQRRDRDELRTRVRLVERLAGLTATIGRELDPDSVAAAVVECAAGIFDGRAVFSRVEGDELVCMATTGLGFVTPGMRMPLAGTNVERAFAAPRLIAVADAGGTPLSVPRGGSILTFACTSGAQLVGGLAVTLDQAVSELTDEQRDIIRLIGAQGEVALVNAQTHAALLNERLHEQAVVDVLGDGVIVAGADGIITSCNNAAASLVGWERERLIGQSLPAQLSRSDGEVRRLPNGVFIETVRALLPQTGESVITLRDVSRQQQLDETKDLFLATTSHELRTPLTAIKGYVSTLQRHWDRLDDADRRSALHIVDEQTDNLVRLTDHLLLGARAGSGQLPRTAFDVAEVATAAAAAYAQLSSGHVVTARLARELPMAVGDPSGTRSVLGQLIENAVKYSPSGGEIEVAVSCDSANGRVVVDVLDRGVGIEPDKLDSIFTPFYQGQSANTRTFGGVGLGLFIVRRLVEAQGGQVSAHCRAGGGADMRFWLPAALMPSHHDVVPEPCRTPS